MINKNKYSGTIKISRKKRFSSEAVCLVLYETPLLAQDSKVVQEARRMKNFMIDSVALKRKVKIPIDDYNCIARQGLIEQFDKLNGLEADDISDPASLKGWITSLEKILGKRPLVKKVSWELIYRYTPRVTIFLSKM